MWYNLSQLEVAMLQGALNIEILRLRERDNYSRWCVDRIEDLRALRDRLYDDGVWERDK